MKRNKILLLLIALFIPGVLISAPGDTLNLVPIEFQGAREGWFEFPEAGTSFEKILMDYKLRCPPGKPCGEWDYDVYLYIRKYYVPNYKIGNSAPDTIFYLTSPGWNYTPIMEDGKIVGLDSTEKDPVLLYSYDIEDPQDPTVATNSTPVWTRYYINYIKEDGTLDSVLSGYDEKIAIQKKQVYFNNDVTIFDQIEIFRYITPYGNGLSLGDGFAWTIDMSDFRPFLTGKVFFHAPATPSWIAPMSQNAYEDLELSFDFIEGTPERDIIKMEHLWSRNVRYDENYENSFPEFEYTYSENTQNARLKLIHTGHGFGHDTENCAEFCEKNAFLFVNGDEIWKQNVWRECGNNPVYPQGGTWLADRANWCPGAEVVPYDIELTGTFTPGAATLLNFDMEYFEPVVQDTNSTPANYKSSAYMIEYGELNFDYDVEITDVLSPNNKDMYRRFNPTCSNPEIIIRNRGKETITSLDIVYSVNGGEEILFEWNGNIEYSEQDTVLLPNIDWKNRPEGNFFNVSANNPNGNSDEYPSNNDAYTEFEQVIEMHQNMVLEFRTVNYDAYNAASPYAFRIYDASGNVVKSRNSTQNSTTYTDTLNLENGCYTFVFTNMYGYGLSYWPLTQLSNGYLKFTKYNAELKKFNPDFGNTQYMQFVVKDQPELEIVGGIDTLDLGTIDKSENTSKTIQIFAKNSEPVVISDLEIKLGSIKGFSIISTNPQFDDEITITENEGLEIEIGLEGKLTGEITSALTIKTENTFLGNYNIPLKGFVKDPSSVNETPDNKVFIKAYHDRSNNVELYFSSQDYQNNAEIFISDILGNRIKSIYAGAINDSEQVIQLDRSGLGSGVYFVTLKCSGSIARTSFVLTN